MRLGQRVAQQRLQHRPGGRQRAADDHPHQRARQADAEEDDRVDVALRRAEQGAPQVDALGADQRAAEHRRRQHAEQDQQDAREALAGEMGGTSP